MLENPREISAKGPLRGSVFVCLDCLALLWVAAQKQNPSQSMTARWKESHEGPLEGTLLFLGGARAVQAHSEMLPHSATLHAQSSEKRLIRLTF